MKDLVKSIRAEVVNFWGAPRTHLLPRLGFLSATFGDPGFGLHPPSLCLLFGFPFQILFNRFFLWLAPISECAIGCARVGHFRPSQWANSE